MSDRNDSEAPSRSTKHWQQAYGYTVLRTRGLALAAPLGAWPPPPPPQTAGDLASLSRTREPERAGSGQRPSSLASKTEARSFNFASKTESCFRFPVQSFRFNLKPSIQRFDSIARACQSVDSLELAARLLL